MFRHILFTATLLLVCGQLANAAGAGKTQRAAELSRATSVQSLRGVSVPTDPGLLTGGATLSWRWIGIKPGGPNPCPDPGFWTVSSMFFLNPDGQTIPLALRDYCLYEAPANVTVTQTDTERLKDLLGQGELIALDPDVLAVSPLGSDLGDATYVLLQDVFAGEAGATRQALPLFDPPRLRYTFIDTAPSNDFDPLAVVGNSEHGFTLLNAAARLLCGEEYNPQCAIHLASRLGLAFTCFDQETNLPSCRDEVGGGYVGTIGDIARAIREETEWWQLVDPAQTRLVLNLSLGWQSVFGGDEADPEDMTAPVRAVYDALREASCRGVLVFAAAGNRHGGPDEAAGPLYPAGWERFRAPGLADCIRILGENPPAGELPPDVIRVARPLIYAVGGVDIDAKPLDNTLAGSEPRLVAYSDHMAARAQVLGGPAGTLTGSSVATMVVSAAAAAAAYYHPNYPPYSIVEQIYADAIPLGRGSSVCLGGNNCDVKTEVKLVRTCDSLQRICNNSGMCPGATVIGCENTTPLTFNGITLPPFDDPGYAVQYDFNDLTAVFPQSAVCGAEDLYFREGIDPADPCPDKQYHGELAEPWVDPQPGSTGCPNCGVRFSSNRAAGGTATELLVEIDDGYAGVISELILRCDSTTYAIPVAAVSGGLVAGDRLRVVGPTVCGRGGKVELSLTSEGSAGPASITAPLLVVDDT